jgi:hypothetical protein
MAKSELLVSVGVVRLDLSTSFKRCIRKYKWGFPAIYVAYFRGYRLLGNPIPTS